MEHYIGLTLTSTTDVNQTLVFIDAFDKVIINVYNHSKTGEITHCGICLDAEQRVAMYQWLTSNRNNG
jgi:hypothetical protein